MAEEGDNGEYFNPEEEVKIVPEKPCELPIIENNKNGEEDEDCIYKCRGRLYRLRESEWKERGTGDIKLLRHKTGKKIRMIMRQDKTLKVVANFYISENPLCDLKPHQDSDKMFFFGAYDCSDEQPVIEKFVVKLGNADKAKDFLKNFNDAKLFNTLLKEGKESELKYAPIFVDKEKDDKKTDANKTAEKKE